jgi:hypothetical protein
MQQFFFKGDLIRRICSTGIRGSKEQNRLFKESRYHLHIPGNQREMVAPARILELGEIALWNCCSYF